MKPGHYVPPSGHITAAGLTLTKPNSQTAKDLMLCRFHVVPVYSAVRCTAYCVCSVQR